MKRDADIDDINCLSVDLQHIYVNPHKALGVDQHSVNIGLLREVFRKSCVALIPHFVGCGKSKLTEKQLNFAYHLVRGNVKGPTKAISDNFNSNPYLDFRADYILPMLKPMEDGSVTELREHRGFRMLAVSSSSNRASISYFMIPKFVFVFDVHYVMRGHKVERSHEEFVALHGALSKELLTVPLLPQFLAGQSVDLFGAQLAQYVMRIHVTLANKGLFSPRLMRFLAVDFERVQTEEEGALVALLDTPHQPPQTAWYMVDEKWLSAWRGFVMGRGPRRYLAPGPVDNRNLLQELRAGRTDLRPTRDYRCVNFNVWRFYQLAHGGGPAISRLAEDIYSARAYSSLQAAVMIQTRMRMHLCRKRRRELFMRRLSTTQAAKTVIMEAAMEEMRLRADAVLLEARRERIRRDLEGAAVLTQSLWRLKKRVIPEENLEAKQRDQMVFSRVRALARDVPESQSGAGVVVSDLQSIVHIGSTGAYKRELTDAEGGIPFTVSRRTGTQDAQIEATTDPSQFPRGSRIVAINGRPTGALSFEEVQSALAVALFPVALELERPLDRSLAPGLDDIISVGAENEALRFSAFKLMLQHGLPLVKHNSGNGKYHLSVLRISDKDLFYRSAFDPRRAEDALWNRLSLYSLKFVLTGVESAAVRRKRLDPRFCFEVVSEGRGLVFEVPTAAVLQALESREWKMKARRLQGTVADGSVDGSQYGGSDAGSCRSPPSVSSLSSASAAASPRHLQSFYELVTGQSGGSETDAHAARVRIVVEQLRRLVEEVRGSQIFVDKAGLPVRRNKPKITLRQVNG